jgi:hypothetical protein
MSGSTHRRSLATSEPREAALRLVDDWLAELEVEAA